MSDLPLPEQVAATFAADEQPEVLRLLLSYGGGPGENEPARVRWVILALANGSLAQIRTLVAMARVDYRDVLVADPGYYRRADMA